MSFISGPKDVLHEPPSGRYIFLSLVIAILFYLLPVNGALVFLRVELPLLVVLYWSIHQPNRVGFAVGFILGLLVDVSDGNILGQHAIAYTLAVFFCSGATGENPQIHALAASASCVSPVAGSANAGGAYPSFCAIDVSRAGLFHREFL